MSDNALRGKYIVLEGGEGVGKSTQIDMLSKALSILNIPNVVMREPGSAPFAVELRKILKTGPKRSSTANLFAFNAARAESLLEISKHLDQGTWVLSDRSYLSTIAYQGHAEGLPLGEVRQICELAVKDTHPDLTLILDADPKELADRLRDRDNHDDYFESLGLDFHRKVRSGYITEASRLELPIVNALNNTQQVHEDIWKHVFKIIPKSTLMAHNPDIKPSKKDSDVNYVIKDENGNFQITPEGHQYLEKVVTNTSDNVYAFTDELSNVTVAAAMARLSRRQDDMRVTILDEFVGRKGKDEDLLKRVITAYGDDSVQQLTGIHVVVESASNLLTKKLEWGRLAAYLEQSTRYIYFDQKDERGNFKYYTPVNLDAKLAKEYEAKMNKIFEKYSIIVHKLTEFVRSSSDVPQDERDMAWKGATKAQACDAARGLLPVATKSTVGIFASGQAIESLIMHLQSEKLDEFKITGDKILTEARKVVPSFLERADKPDRGGAMIAYKAETFAKVRKLSREYLPQSLSPSPTQDALLINYTPRNELELIPYMLYEHSNLSIPELEHEISNWPYERKLKVFKTYIGERLNRRHKPGRAFEQAHYSWDLVCDYGIFRDLQRHRMVDDLAWQELTPRYGYDIPKLIEDANLSELFEDCFDISYQLYSQMQEAGYELEAQYATLLGHRMRWKVTYNAREAFHLHELRTAPQGHPGYRKLVKTMHDKIAEIHPLTASGMKFINKDEDPKLTRLAAERYSQFKLKELDRKTK
ncbi:dTMP kinase [Candidatus Saccharibacteria bacterium CPR2]|nr:dTMP kinase [Candidatus Saccharibacteria bacterium CPR2]